MFDFRTLRCLTIGRSSLMNKCMVFLGSITATILNWILHFAVVLVVVTLIFCIPSLKNVSLFTMMVTLNGVYFLSILYQIHSAAETSRPWPDLLSMSFCLGIILLLFLLPIAHPNWTLTNFLLTDLLGILILWSLALDIVDEFFS